ncbi:hypothetical protein [Streptomyces sp. BA2]|uniref:hypothetical protein n=1 Tax=Streptomyces sp. BA2 TaxID=436595 RepID=UPI0013240511|nr:hypothetical protein [Streptomyces sp. BA2]MWA07724.1 hypothetical protein [Streptomyces sp. BA2]
MGVKLVVAASVIGVCVAGAFATAVVNGPFGTIDSSFNRPAHEEYEFETGAEAKKARPTFQDWLPDNASSITYALKRPSGAQLVKATVKDGKLPAGCNSGTDLHAPAPKIEAAWFPKGIADKAVARCDLYYAYTDGSTLYAWQNTDQHDAEK